MTRDVRLKNAESERATPSIETANDKGGKLRRPLMRASIIRRTGHATDMGEWIIDEADC